MTKNVIEMMENQSEELAIAFFVYSVAHVYLYAYLCTCVRAYLFVCGCMHVLSTSTHAIVWVGVA